MSVSAGCADFTLIAFQRAVAEDWYKWGHRSYVHYPDSRTLNKQWSYSQTLAHPPILSFSSNQYKNTRSKLREGAVMVFVLQLQKKLFSGGIISRFDANSFVMIFVTASFFGCTKVSWPRNRAKGTVFSANVFHSITRLA